MMVSGTPSDSEHDIATIRGGHFKIVGNVALTPLRNTSATKTRPKDKSSSASSGGNKGQQHGPSDQSQIDKREQFISMMENATRNQVEPTQEEIFHLAETLTERETQEQQTGVGSSKEGRSTGAMAYMTACEQMGGMEDAGREPVNQRRSIDKKDIQDRTEDSCSEEGGSSNPFRSGRGGEEEPRPTITQSV